MSEVLAAVTSQTDAELIEELAQARARIAQEIGKRVVGQEGVIEQLLIALFSRGHCLFVGVPGLAKTLLISTLAEALSLTFNRIQFTPDLMPSDITGTDILEEDHTTGRRTFRFVQGPIFAHVLLADEINRTPPKTQAALLQAMQEHRVTAGGRTYPLEEPFLVFATQNPIEQEGTYPLPEAQLDRFMLELRVGYPNRDEELAILDRMSATRPDIAVQPVLGPIDLVELRAVLDGIHIDDRLKGYIVDIVHATRRPAEYGLDLGPFIQLPASPRATIFLTRAARGQALLAGRAYVTPQDIKSIAYDVMRHRLGVTYEAEAEEITAETILGRILDHLPVP